MAVVIDYDDLRDAHQHSSYHRTEIESSPLCGCFQCLKTFDRHSIRCFVDTGQTAVCPFCSTDAVIGSASGFPLTREFLVRMHDRWFNPID